MIIKNQIIIINSKKSINKIKNIFGELNEIQLNAEQLMEYLPNSRKRIKFKCDDCSDVFESCCYVHKFNEKHLCKNCKRKQTNLKNWGVENISQNNLIKNKKEQTCLNNFGVLHPGQSEEIKKKSKETLMKNYGVENPGESKEIRHKIKQTNLKRYGVENTFQSKEKQYKIKQTNLKRYGVENVRQSKEIQKKIEETNLKRYGVKVPMQNLEIKKKVQNTLYENGTGICSKQQRYIYELLGGKSICKLCYPAEYFELDIAYPDEMIYIEYNGGGHYAYALYYGKTLDEINQKDMQREYILKRKGWKLIKIISMKDKLPSDQQIILLINEAKNYLLNTNHTWVEINIDNNRYLCKEYVKNIY